MSDLLQPGQIFAGRYRIEKFLAQGGFGAVYVAEQIETELRVALKVLWAHVLESPDAVEKFRLEARVAGRASSEHIVRVIDAGLDETTRMPFLVMELLAGEDLGALVDSRGPLSPEQVAAYFKQIASALDKAHGYVDRDGTPRPIVHRDLKPENIFLAQRESGDSIIKILDFGIAKVLSDSTKVSQEVKGTPVYMAFEQASAGRITPQTDIWALGLIAFYLLTGRSYWKTVNKDEATIFQLFGELLTMPLDPASERARLIGAPVALSSAFDAWFVRCVNREVGARFATAGECAASLATALGVAGPRAHAASLDPNAFAETVLAAAPAGPSIPAGAPAAPRARAHGAEFGSTTAPVEIGPRELAATAPATTVRMWLVAAVVLGLAAIGAAVAMRAGQTADAEPTLSPGVQEHRVAASQAPPVAPLPIAAPAIAAPIPQPAAASPTPPPASVPTSVTSTQPKRQPSATSRIKRSAAVGAGRAIAPSVSATSPSPEKQPAAASEVYDDR